MSFVLDSFRTWFRNIALYSAITLVVWIPANIVLTALMAWLGDDLTPSMALRLPMLFEGVLGPLSIGAVLFATDQLVTGERVRFGEAMRHGFSNWGRLFATRFVSNLLMWLGFLCLVIPGIVMLVRFAFIDQAVIVDKLDHTAARQRTWDLVPKVLGRLILLVVVFFGLLLVLSAVLYIPLEVMLDDGVISMMGYHIGDVVVSCIIELLYVPVIIAMYFLYKEALGEPVAPVRPSPDSGSEFETFELPPDDGNPYNTPHSQ